jgi:ATP-dependent DNA ligase
MLQRSGRAAGLIEPCLPSPAKAPPSGPDWLHEIKHDGFRILARRDAASVRLYTRNGNDLSKRFPLVVAAIATLPARSCLIDGEAIVSDGSGLAVIRSWHHDANAVLGAFDLLELDGEDLRRLPIEIRKTDLAQLLRSPHPGIALNKHHVGHGDIVYQQGLQARLRGHRVEAARLGVPLRPIEALAQGQEPGATSRAREAEEQWRK